MNCLSDGRVHVWCIATEIPVSWGEGNITGKPFLEYTKGNAEIENGM
jgi:hypothetical protein